MPEWDFSEVSRLAATFTRRDGQIEKGAETVMGKAAADITRDAKTLAPVDTGNLKNSISYSGSGLEYEVAPTAEYAIYQELGTSRAPAQPFMAPALERNTPGIMSAFEELAGGRWDG